MVTAVMLLVTGCSRQQLPTSPTLANPTPGAGPTEAVMSATGQTSTDEIDMNLGIVQ